MANVIEADTPLWLRNKLDNEDQWSSGGLASLLTTDVLRNTYRCFRGLDHRVRLKLLLAFLEIRRRNLESFKEELSMVINLGIDDEDDWVRLVACILSDYPHSATFHPDIREGSETFNQLVNELKEQVSESSNQWTALPCECPYLNKTALTSSFGSQPPPAKNFTLRRKPKSAALRAHLTQKASEVASHRRASANQPHSTPLSPIKKNAGFPKDMQRQHSTPSKPQPIVPIRQHTRPTMRESHLPKKTKLLDITEQPIGVTSRESKKRRKHTDADNAGEETKHKRTSEHHRQTKNQKHAGTKADNAITDYAAGLTGPKEQAQPKEEPKKEPEEEAKPSYALIPGAMKKPTYAPTVSSVPTPRTSDINSGISVDPNASIGTQEVQRELQIRMRQQEVQLQQQLLLKDAKLKAAGVTDGLKLLGLSKQPPPSHPQKDLKDAQRAALEISQSMNKQVKQSLSLTKEQMLAAQEMFRSANKVTRAEKALILGFMAGARDNPFPQQGPVLTIKLSENTETNPSGSSSSQTTLIEMLFEMNYDTGHWRRLKRTRVLAPMNDG